ncbi:MAG: CoA transferase, partial [Steroidobacteraceae bacterium]|nr:CoA transferase [Deltaproteobacteria bacterium]
MKVLAGIKIVNLAANLPGPAAAQRLSRMGANVIKIEAPAGDPMEIYSADWYRDMAAGHTVVRLDLKLPAGKEILLDLLSSADVLITATRPAAMERLGLGPAALQQKFPRLCQTIIVGYPAPRDNEAGHDLTYQASMGLIDPPHMPRTLLSDMAGAERAVSSTLALLFNRERSGVGGHDIVALSEAAEAFAEPLRYGSTVSGASLGGGIPEYNIYRTADGWVAVAALEPHFKQRLEGALNISTPEEYRAAFAGQS